MFLSARITNIGRRLIAKGNFNIKYFQIGDSEFDYSNNELQNQKIFSSFDIECGVKYPYKSIDNKNYGNLVEESQTKTIRSIVNSIGFVSDYIEFNEHNGKGTIVKNYSELYKFSILNGNNKIQVNNINNFKKGQFLTISLNDFGGMDSDVPMILNNSTSLTFKVIDVKENILTLDRNLPNLSTIHGNVRLLINDTQSWTCVPIWGDEPIGLNKIKKTQYTSTKEYLGYSTNDSQIFVDSNNKPLSHPTSFINSFNEKIYVLPNNQRCISILHYSISFLPQNSDFKNTQKVYENYISYDAPSVKSKIVYNENGDLISDTEYFEIFVPFIHYHKNTSSIPGAIFKMGKENFFIKSTKNDFYGLMFRYLIDEKGNNVGKVFPHKQIVVFDDQELVAILDHKTNRKYTLPSPKVTTTLDENNPLFKGDNESIWITYTLSNEKNKSLNSLPCNYYNHLFSENNSSIVVEFGKDTFTNMRTTINEIKNGFVADRFQVLIQITEKNKKPESSNWKIMDLTSQIENHIEGEFINPENLTNQSFLIDKNLYDKSIFFNLENHLTEIKDISFGEEQPFPGSIRAVKASDIEEMRFLITTPQHDFIETQNPTYQEGQGKKVTEIALLNENKEVLVMAKTAVPIVRNKSQVFAVKIDF